MPACFVAFTRGYPRVRGSKRNSGHPRRALRWWDGANWAAAYQHDVLAPNHDYDWLVPVNRDGLAVAAGYLGVLSLIPNPLTSIAAIICGALAIKRVKTSGKLGRGRAIFGVIMGALSLGFFLFVWIATSGHSG